MREFSTTDRLHSTLAVARKCTGNLDRIRVGIRRQLGRTADAMAGKTPGAKSGNVKGLRPFFSGTCVEASKRRDT